MLFFGGIGGASYAGFPAEFNNSANLKVDFGFADVDVDDDDDDDDDDFVDRVDK